MVDAVGTTAFTYASGGELLTEDGPFASDTVSNIYSARRRIGFNLQQPTGAWTNAFGYDNAERFASVASPAGTFVYTYPAGLPSRLPRKLALPQNSYLTNTYDNVARLTGTFLKTSGGTVLDSAGYGYDRASERTAFTNAANAYVLYAYDKLGQLKVATSSVAAENRGYQYDPGWNLNYRTNNGVTAAFAVDVKNQLTSAAGWACTYDANGNLAQLGDPTTVGAFLYRYDDENRLSQVSTNYNPPAGPLSAPGGGEWKTDFVYDGLGRLRQRLESVSGVLQTTTLYIYDGARVIQERDGGNNNPLTSYTRGPDLSGTLQGAGGIGGLLARSSGFSGSGWSANLFYHADGNGNVTYLVDTNQALAASYRYDPFGNTITSSGVWAGENLYRFSSKEVHANSGMYYFLYRFYDPNLQRWINRDPVQEWGGINLYGYVRNRPSNCADPFGLHYAELYASYGATGGAAGVAAASIGADLVSFGLNAPATPLEVAGGAAIGGLIGYGIGAFVDWLAGHRQPVMPSLSSPRKAPNYRVPRLPQQPCDAPGSGWQWRGSGPPGSPQGSWYDPTTNQSLHPDMNHPAPIGPHWDWRDPGGNDWRVFPDGRVEPK